MVKTPKTSKQICSYLDKLLSQYNNNEFPSDFERYKRDVLKFSKLVSKNILPAIVRDKSKDIPKRKLPNHAEQPMFLFQVATEAQKLCIFLIVLNIEKQAELARSAQKEADVEKIEKELLGKVARLERCVSGYWHPAAEEKFEEIRVEKNVMIGGVQWFLVSVKYGDREVRFWTIESIMAKKLKNLKINLEIPEEIHSVSRKDEAEHCHLKLDVVEKRYKNKIAEMMAEKEELLLCLKNFEKKLADAQAVIEKSGLEKIENFSVNESEAAVKENETHSLSELIKDIKRLKNGPALENKEIHNFFKISVDEYKKLTRENLELAESLKLAKDEYREFRGKSENIIIEKNGHICSLIEENSRLKQSIPKKVTEDKTVEGKNKFEWNDHMEYLKNVLIEFIKHKDMRRDLFPVLRIALNLKEKEVDEILAKTLNFQI